MSTFFSSARKKVHWPIIWAGFLCINVCMCLWNTFSTSGQNWGSKKPVKPSPWPSQKPTSPTFYFSNKQLSLSASLINPLNSLETCWPISYCAQMARPLFTQWISRSQSWVTPACSPSVTVHIPAAPSPDVQQIALPTQSLPLQWP